MGKKSGQQTQTVVEKQGPYAPTTQGLQLGIDELLRIYGGGGGMPTAPDPESFYNTGPGPNYRFMGPESQNQVRQFDSARYNQALRNYQAQLGARSFGQQQGVVPEYGLANAGAEELRKTLGGYYLDQQNPYIDEMIGEVARDVTPRVSGLFAGGSRYGSGAHQATLARELAGASSGLRFANYNAERGRMSGALGMAPQYDMAPYQLYSARQAAPYEGIRAYLSNLMPIANVGSAGSREASMPIYSNPLMGGLSGAAAGAGLGLALKEAGAISSFGPWGWAATGAGALMGLLGSQ